MCTAVYSGFLKPYDSLLWEANFNIYIQTDTLFMWEVFEFELNVSENVVCELAGDNYE